MKVDNDDIEAPHRHRHSIDPPGEKDVPQTKQEQWNSAYLSTEASRLDDPFMPREGRDLVWKDVSMTLSAKGDNPERKLLDNAWGEVPKRHVTAIMGPSGAGKTSLLNILAGRLRTNGRLTVSADVRLNNYAVDPSKIEVRKKIAFVAQEDSLLVTTTPKEAILFSAKLRLPVTMTNQDLQALTDRMITELGMEDCSGTLVKNLSGGEHKRTSIGVELVTRPALVFLDEPTSGLDSFNAVHLCQLLSKVANAGSSVLVTIHQPSSEIYSSFDHLILMNKGRVMYQGSVKGVNSFFSIRGHPVPPNYNPADWILNVALSYTIDELDEAGYFVKDERKIGEAFISEGKDVLAITRRNSEKESDEHIGIWTQSKLLFAREVRNLVRDTHVLKARTAMTCTVSLVIGGIFYQAAQTSFTTIINLQTCFGALIMALMVNVFSTVMPSLVAFPAERPVFLREYSTNHYSVFSYFVSRLLMELIVTGVQVTVSSIITYFLVGFSAQYGFFWSGLYLMACASTGKSVDDTQVPNTAA